jgi:hypothetical protein
MKEFSLGYPVSITHRGPQKGPKWAQCPPRKQEINVIIFMKCATYRIVTNIKMKTIQFPKMKIEKPKQVLSYLREDRL